MKLISVGITAILIGVASCAPSNQSERSSLVAVPVTRPTKLDLPQYAIRFDVADAPEDVLAMRLAHDGKLFAEFHPVEVTDRDIEEGLAQHCHENVVNVELDVDVANNITVNDLRIAVNRVVSLECKHGNCCNLTCFYIVTWVDNAAEGPAEK